MFLANCKIEDVVTEQINAYLAESNLSFQELKTHLINRSPILQVHTAVVNALTERKKQDLLDVTKALETKAYNKQLEADELEAKKERADTKNDDVTKANLLRELDLIPAKISSHESERTLLQHRLNQLRSSHTTSGNQSVRTAENKVLLKIREQDEDINSLRKKQDTAHAKLRKIADKQIEKRKKNNARELRDQARAGYKSTNEGLLLTLSPANRVTLAKSIKDQHALLADKLAQLVAQSEVVHFPLFLKLVSLQLENLPLTKPEIQGLQTIIKLMKQYIQHQQQTAMAQDTLKSKKNSVKLIECKLKTLKDKINTLHKENPDLRATNQKLINENTELKTTHTQNKAIQSRLGTFALVFLALSCIAVVPLILTLNGIIPLFLAPVFVYLIIASPPILLFSTTLGLGIAALVFGRKATLNELQVKTNRSALAENRTHIKQNIQDRKILTTETLPELERQIKADDTIKDALTIAVTDSQRLADELLKRAKEIEPSPSIRSSLFSSPYASESEEEIEAIRETPGRLL